MLNKTTKFLVVFCLLSVIFSTGVWADENHLLPMLRMGVDARALSMGAAYVAEASDASAGYWNPAGLADIEEGRLSLTLMGSLGMSFDRSYNYFGFGYGFSFATVGISWLNAGITDISKRGDSGEDLGTFKDMNNVFLISAATKLKNLSVGGSFKVVNQKIDDYGKTGVGGDVGVKFRPTDKSAIGVILRDIGTKIDGWRVPSNLQFGVAIYPVEGFIFSADGTKTLNTSELAFHMGGEYAYEFCSNWWSKLRAGVNDGRFAIGAGLQFSKVMIDYGYVVEKEDFMKDNHKLSLSFEF
jgi:hypothetical protein